MKLLKISLKAEFFLGAILILIAVLRIPTFFEPYWYGDEGIFAAVANGILNHQALYTQVWDNKPPLIYLTYATIFKFFGPTMFALRSVTAAFVVLTGYLIFETARHIFGLKRAFVSLTIFTILQAQIALEANLALTEIFLITFTSLAFWTYIRLAKGRAAWPYLFSGVALGVGFMYKQVGALDAAALGTFVLFFETKPIKKDFFLTLGFLIPVAIVSLVTIANHTFNEFIFAAFTYYRIYLGEGPGMPPVFSVLKILPVFLVIAYFFFQKKLSNGTDKSSLFLIWLAFALLGALFSGRPYGHYLVQIFPALSLTLAGWQLLKKIAWQKILAVGSIAATVAVVLALAFSSFISKNDPLRLGYWESFFKMISGQKSYKAYSNLFDTNAAKGSMIANYLKNKGAEGNYVYIWGDLPWLYVNANATDPSRYVTSFHVFGVPNGRAEVMGDLAQKPPIFIVVVPNNIGRFDQLESLIAKKYAFDVAVGDILVYRKR